MEYASHLKNKKTEQASLTCSFLILSQLSYLTFPTDYGIIIMTIFFLKKLFSYPSCFAAALLDNAAQLPHFPAVPGFCSCPILSRWSAAQLSQLSRSPVGGPAILQLLQLPRRSTLLTPMSR